MYWCRNSYFGFTLICVWLFHLVLKSSLCVGWPSLPSHRGWPTLGESAYIRANVLLLCLSEAIWQVERRVICVYWNLFPSSMCEGLNCLLRQKYHPRYIFFYVLWTFTYFSVILVHFWFGKVRLWFFHVLWFSYCKTIWNCLII